MNVSELINLVNLLSADKNADELSDRERQAYLVYLNMANADIYKVAAGGLRTLITVREVFFNSDNNYFALPNDLYLIRAVFANTDYRIYSADVDTASNICFDKYLIKGKNLYINNAKNLSGFAIKNDPTADNVSRNYITLYYVPNPLKLVEVVQDENTETNVPVYPEPYHHFIAKRALYYYYFSNKIFLDKMAYLLNDWNNDKAEMARFKNYGL